MTVTNADQMIDTVFSGSHCRKAQGFLFTLPKGMAFRSRFARHAEAAYGSVQHPDIRWISPAGKGGLITIDAVRDAAGFLVSAPSGEGMKTLFVLQADRMNVAAANALLKSLEEPTRHTRIVLSTDNPGRLLPTIRSRCMIIPIRASRAEALVELRDQVQLDELDIAEKQVNPLLDLADDNPGLALSLETQALAPWLKSLPSWLSGLKQKRTPPPLPKGVGTKTGPALEPAALGLQALLTRAARGDGESIYGWPPERLHAACWRMMQLMTDIDRAGLDAKTRLSVLMDTIAETPARS